MSNNRSAVSVRSYNHKGRLLGASRRAIRAGSVKLRRNECMDWHSTNEREELIIMLSGTARIDLKNSHSKLVHVRLSAGRCAFLPKATTHRVVNMCSGTAHYIYVTAPTR